MNRLYYNTSVIPLLLGITLSIWRHGSAFLMPSPATTNRGSRLHVSVLAEHCNKAPFLPSNYGDDEDSSFVFDNFFSSHTDDLKLPSTVRRLDFDTLNKEWKIRTLHGEEYDKHPTSLDKTDGKVQSQKGHEALVSNRSTRRQSKKESLENPSAVSTSNEKQKDTETLSDEESEVMQKDIKDTEYSFLKIYEESKIESLEQLLKTSSRQEKKSPEQDVSSPDVVRDSPQSETSTTSSVPDHESTKHVIPAPFKPPSKARKDSRSVFDSLKSIQPHHSKIQDYKRDRMHGEQSYDDPIAQAIRLQNYKQLVADTKRREVTHPGKDVDEGAETAKVIKAASLAIARAKGKLWTKKAAVEDERVSEVSMPSEKGESNRSKQQSGESWIEEKVRDKEREAARGIVDSARKKTIKDIARKLEMESPTARPYWRVAKLEQEEKEQAIEEARQADQDERVSEGSLPSENEESGLSKQESGESWIEEKVRNKERETARGIVDSARKKTIKDIARKLKMESPTAEPYWRAAKLEQEEKEQELEEARRADQETKVSFSLVPLTDEATRVEFLPVLGPGLYLVGVGVRRKLFLKIYSVGMYTNEDAKMALSSISRRDKKKALSSLQSAAKSFPTSFLLEMVSRKSADWVSNVIAKGVACRYAGHDSNVEELRSLVFEGINSIGGKTCKGTKLQFDCTDNGLSLKIDGEMMGTVLDSRLSEAFCDMYLDEHCLSRQLCQSCLENSCLP